MAENNTNKSSNRMRKGVLAVALLCGIGAVGGVVGTGAFFTDKATADSTVNVGTMNMKVADLSDLDGNYATLQKVGYQGADYTLPDALDKDNPSTGIINPGDTGIYAYKIENTGEKSFDTAKVTRVTIKLKDASATMDAAGDNGSYTIDGLGTAKPVVKGNTMVLTYAANDSKVLSGSKENDGDGTSAAYAYNTVFSRGVKNKFQGATITIHTDVYAKQHRNSIDSELKIADDGTVNGTGDWTEIGSFEQVVD